MFHTTEKEKTHILEVFRRERLLALLLALTLACGVFGTGCGNTDAAADGGSAAEENAGGEAAENNENTEAAETEEATALSIMQSVNVAETQDIDDNYRSWYEVFVYSFYDSDGDGVGDLNGVTQMLDYINDGDPDTDTDLGCNGIWLMPVMPSTTYHKYDVTDYYDIDSEYGTLEDFQTLLAECHARGIHVILDLVLNHTSSKHPWFLEAYTYLQGLAEGEEPDVEECPYVEYYNFTTDYSSSCYQVAGTQWYYEAPFWSEMPDLNLDSEAVREEIRAIAEYWLDLGVDGFRLDAAKEYYSGNLGANVEFLSWFDAQVEELSPDAYIVAEVWTELDTYAQYYASGIDSCFDFTFADSDGVIAKAVKNSSAESYADAILRMQEAISAYSDDYIDAPFYTNHDISRSAGYYTGDYSENQVKMAQALNLLMSGSAFLYYGEEIGMKGSGADENKRAPMYWSEDAQAEGMCAGPVDMGDFSMKYESLEGQLADGNSIFYFVEQTLALRAAYPAIARGTVTVEEVGSDECVCVLRKTWEASDGEQELFLVFNLSAEEQELDLSGLGELALGGVLVTTAEELTLDGAALHMPMYSVAVLLP